MDQLPLPTHAARYAAWDPSEAQSLAETCAVHATPQHGSWVPRAAIALRQLSRQCLGGRLAAKATRVQKVQAWHTQRNEPHAKAHGQCTTDDARVKLRSLYPRVST